MATSAGTSDLIPLARGEVVLISFDVDPAADLRLFANATYCYDGQNDRSYLGLAWLEIVDGALRPWPDVLAPGHMSWWPGADSAEVGVEGVTIRQSAEGGDACARSSYVASPKHSGATRELTVAFVALAGTTTVDFNVVSNRTVPTVTTAVAHGIALTKQDMAHGVAASAYPWGFSGSAGARLSHSIHLDGDAIGWFWPSAFSSPDDPQEWSCTIVGTDCSAPSNRPRMLSAGSDGDLEIASVGYVAPGERPYYFTYMVELPGDYIH